MTGSETDSLVLERIEELLGIVKQQGRKIDNLSKRLDKLEHSRRPSPDHIHTCEGSCFSIPDEFLPALENPAAYAPKPGEETPKENKSQTEMKKTFWKKFE
jgi:hypothetical protein